MYFCFAYYSHFFLFKYQQTWSSSTASSSVQLSKKVANCTLRFPSTCRDAPTTFKEFRLLERASCTWRWWRSMRTNTRKNMQEKRKLKEKKRTMRYIYRHIDTLWFSCIQNNDVTFSFLFLFLSSVPVCPRRAGKRWRNSPNAELSARERRRCPRLASKCRCFLR